jgi:hypothetical protein
MEGWLNVEIYAGRSLCQAVELTDFFLSNRFFQVFLGDKSGRWRGLNNGLPQGNVLVPLLLTQPVLIRYPINFIEPVPMC